MISLLQLLWVLTAKNLKIRFQKKRLLLLELFTPIICFFLWAVYFKTKTTEVAVPQLNDPQWFNHTSDQQHVISTNLTQSAITLTNHYRERCKQQEKTNNMTVTTLGGLDNHHCAYIIAWVSSPHQIVETFHQLYYSALPESMKNDGLPILQPHINFNLYTSAEMKADVIRYDGLRIAAAVDFKHTPSHDHLAIGNNNNNNNLQHHDEDQLDVTWNYKLYTRSFTNEFQMHPRSNMTYPQAADRELLKFDKGIRFAMHNLIQQSILRHEGLYSIGKEHYNESNNTNNNNNDDDEQRQHYFNSTLDKINYNITLLPAREYLLDGPLEAAREWTFIFLSLSFIPMLISFTYLIMQEKGLLLHTTLIQLSGATKPLYILSHFFAALLINIIPLISVTFIVWYHLFNNVGFGVLFIFFVLYFYAVLSFYFCAQSCFTRPKGSYIAGIILAYIIITGLVLIGDGYLNETLQFWSFSLFNFQTVLIEFHINLWKLDLHHGSVQIFPIPHNLLISRGIFNCLQGYVLLIFQCIFYTCLGIYIQNITKNSKLKIAQRPFYYPFLPSYWKDLFHRFQTTLTQSKINSELRLQYKKQQDELLKQQQGEENGYQQLDMTSPYSPFNTNNTMGDDNSNNGLLSSHGSNNNNKEQQQQQQQDVLFLHDDNDEMLMQSDFIQPLSPTETQNIGLRIKHITKIYNNIPVVQDCTVDFVRGELTYICGKNASGKSVLLSILCGLIEPTYGTYYLFDNKGCVITNPSAHIGICLQSDTLWPDLSIYDTLLLHAHIKQFAAGLVLTTDQIHQEILKQLTRVRLNYFTNDLTYTKIKDLNSNQKRLVCFAVALLLQPSFLFLDDILHTTMNDHSIQRNIVKILQDEKQRGTTIILTTNQMSQCDFADRIFIMTAGRLLIAGTPMYLLTKFNCGYVLTLDKYREDHRPRDSLAQREENDLMNMILDNGNGLDQYGNNNNNNNSSHGLGNSIQPYNHHNNNSSGESIVSKINHHTSYTRSTSFSTRIDESSKFILNGNDISVVTTKSGQAIIDLIAEIDDIADILTLHTDTTHCIKFNIPFELSSHIPNILNKLEELRSTFITDNGIPHIASISVNITSLNDIFLVANNAVFVPRQINSTNNNNNDNNTDYNNEFTRSGTTSINNQSMANNYGISGAADNIIFADEYNPANNNNNNQNNIHHQSHYHNQHDLLNSTAVTGSIPRTLSVLEYTSTRLDDRNRNFTILTKDLWDRRRISRMSPFYRWITQCWVLFQRRLLERWRMQSTFLSRYLLPIVIILVFLGFASWNLTIVDVKIDYNQYPLSRVYYSILNLDRIYYQNNNQQKNIQQIDNNIITTPTMEPVKYDIQYANNFTRSFVNFEADGDDGGHEHDDDDHLQLINQNVINLQKFYDISNSKFEVLPYDITQHYKWYNTAPWDDDNNHELNYSYHQQQEKEEKQYQLRRNMNFVNNDNNDDDVYPNYNTTQYINTIPGYFMNHTAYLLDMNRTMYESTTPSYFTINTYNATSNWERSYFEATGTIYINGTTPFTGIAALTRLYETISGEFPTLSIYGEHNNNNIKTKSISTTQQSQTQTPKKLKFIVEEASLPNESHHLASIGFVSIASLLVLILFPQKIIYSLVKERKTSFLLLLRLSQCYLSAYYIANFLFDILEFIITLFILVIPWILPIAPHLPFVISLYTFLLYGTMMILFAYIFQFGFNNPSSAQRWFALYLFIINPIITSIPYIKNQVLIIHSASSTTGNNNNSTFYPHPLFILLALFNPVSIPIGTSLEHDGRQINSYQDINSNTANYYNWSVLLSLFGIWIIVIPIYIFIICILHYCEDTGLFSKSITQYPMFTKFVHILCCFGRGGCAKRYIEPEPALSISTSPTAQVIKPKHYNQNVLSMKKRILSQNWPAQNKYVLEMYQEQCKRHYIISKSTKITNRKKWLKMRGKLQKEQERQQRRKKDLEDQQRNNNSKVSFFNITSNNDNNDNKKKKSKPQQITKSTRSLGLSQKLLTSSSSDSDNDKDDNKKKIIDNNNNNNNDDEEEEDDNDYDTIYSDDDEDDEYYLNDDINNSNNKYNTFITPIVAHGLRKVYPPKKGSKDKKPIVALNDIYFDCPLHTTNVFIGPSGSAGKSTLLKTLALSLITSPSKESIHSTLLQKQQEKEKEQQKNDDSNNNNNNNNNKPVVPPRPGNKKENNNNNNKHDGNHNHNNIIQHTAYINGFDINKDKTSLFMKEPIGYSPQDDSHLIDWMTPREIFKLYCSIRGITPKRTELFINDLIISLNLLQIADSLIYTFTSGERARISVGCALIGNPSIVLLDSPTSNTDIISMRAIQILLQHTSKHRTLIMTSTNILDDVEIADNVFILNKGEIVSAGSPAELKYSLGDNQYVIQLNTLIDKELFVVITFLSMLCKVAIPPLLLKSLIQYSTPTLPPIITSTTNNNNNNNIHQQQKQHGYQNNNNNNNFYQGNTNNQNYDLFSSNALQQQQPCNLFQSSNGLLNHNNNEVPQKRQQQQQQQHVISPFDDEILLSAKGHNNNNNQYLSPSPSGILPDNNNGIIANQPIISPSGYFNNNNNNDDNQNNQQQQQNLPLTLSQVSSQRLQFTYSTNLAANPLYKSDFANDFTNPNNNNNNNNNNTNGTPNKNNNSIHVLGNQSSNYNSNMNNNNHYYNNTYNDDDDNGLFSSTSLLGKLLTATPFLGSSNHRKRKQQQQQIQQQQRLGMYNTNTYDNTLDFTRHTTVGSMNNKNNNISFLNNSNTQTTSNTYNQPHTAQYYLQSYQFLTYDDIKAMPCYIEFITQCQQKGCRIYEESFRRVVINVKPHHFSIADIFILLQKIQNDIFIDGEITSFSVSQMTLEQVYFNTLRSIDEYQEIQQRNILLGIDNNNSFDNKTNGNNNNNNNGGGDDDYLYTNNTTNNKNNNSSGSNGNSLRFKMNKINNNNDPQQQQQQSFELHDEHQKKINNDKTTPIKKRQIVPPPPAAAMSSSPQRPPPPTPLVVSQQQQQSTTTTTNGDNDNNTITLTTSPPTSPSSTTTTTTQNNKKQKDNKMATLTRLFKKE